MAADESRRISRRELLKRAGAAGAAVVLPGALQAEPPAAPSSSGVALPVLPSAADGATVPGAALPLRRQLPITLSSWEFEILDAMIARLIPSDEMGPGAREAGAIHYIDRELGGALSAQREAYRSGLEALDRYARYSRGAPFIELSPMDQDSLLIDVQGGSATATGTGWSGSSAAFFNLVRSHTWQGMFGDPFYGGNRDFIGWDLLRYPGARMGVSAADQARMEAGELPPNHRSAHE
jgi:gluconate 2-dehydrogenase gamma chain